MPNSISPLWLGIIDPDYFDLYQSKGMRAKHFYMPEDTDAFCRLVEKSVRPGDFVVDLGCGDGIATAHALASGARRVLGVDLSPVAIQSTLDNYRIYERNIGGTDSILEVVQADLLDVLLMFQSPRSRNLIDVIVSNPPYIPVGEEVAVETVDGGPEGLRFIDPLLRNSGRFCTRLGWLQGSFSNPLKAIRIAAENKWRCSYIFAYAVKFRENAHRQASYIESLQQRGEAFIYLENDKMTRWFIKLGLVCNINDKPSSSNSDHMGNLINALEGFLTAFRQSGPQIANFEDYKFPVPVEYGIYPR